MKSLKNFEIEYSKKEKSNFWVAEIFDEKIGENLLENDRTGNKIIIGCVGFKKSRAFGQKTKVRSALDENNYKTEAEIDTSKRSNNDSYPGKTVFEESSNGAVLESIGEVSHLCVRSQYRQVGLGRHLMGCVVKWAKECSVESVVLPEVENAEELNSENVQINIKTLDLTVLTELSAAHNLYLALGFSDQGQKVDLGKNCFLQHMSLPL